VPKPIVPLIRRFSPVPKSETDEVQEEMAGLFRALKPICWEQIEQKYRCVILAGAGAGKTHEMLARAKYADERGRHAFFVRIEDIEESFEDAFEVGDAKGFQGWLDGQNEGWFFLDSIDEARLSHPRAFDLAIRRFANRIKGAEHRAHVIVSGRPYAWRAVTDRAMLERLLPFAAPKVGVEVSEGSEADQNSELVEQDITKPESALEIHILRDLDEDDIRMFAAHRGANNIEELIAELYRSNLMALAARPHDLLGILAKWEADSSLGGRYEFLRYGIDDQLREIDPSRAQLQPLSPEKALNGARLLAAAVVLTGEPGLRVPDSEHSEQGLDAEALLSDWDSRDVRALLERGLFSDVLFGMVRFRHRNVRELLTAEWLAKHLEGGNARHNVETLIFREQYGERTIAPRLRPILPWLILLDESVRRKAIAIAPEVVVEGGDPARLPLAERRAILEDIVDRIARDEDGRSARDNDAIARIAQSDLTEDALRLIDTYSDNDDALFFLGRLVWQGKMVGCLHLLCLIAGDPGRGVWARVAAARAVMTVGTRDLQDSLWDALLALQNEFPRRLLVELVEDAQPDMQTIVRLLASMERLPPYDRFEATGFTNALRGLLERVTDDDALAQLVVGINDLLDQAPFIERRECRVSKNNAWLLGPAVHAVEQLIRRRSTRAFDPSALDVMQKLPAARFWGDVELKDDKTKLHDLVPDWLELNDALFWADVANVRAHELKKDERLTDDWPLQWREHFWQFEVDSLERVIGFAANRAEQDDRLVAVSLAYRIIRVNDLPPEKLADLRARLGADPVARAQLEELVNKPVSKESKSFQKRTAERQRKQDRKKLVETEKRKRWIQEMQADPDRIQHPKGAQPGELTGDQFCLQEAVDRGEEGSSKYGRKNWQSLIPEFGNEVAMGYRDAAIAYWRAYTPPLASEGHSDSATPYALIFGLSGLEIESREEDRFAESLTEADVRHAMRYATWELNGFPTWLETLHDIHPDLVRTSLLTELWWEFDHAAGDEIRGLLHDLVYHAPWFHEALVEPLLKRLASSPLPRGNALRYCLHILRSGRTEPHRLVALAQKGITDNSDKFLRATLYALWVDAEAETALPALERWLAAIPNTEASEAAQAFVTALTGTRRFCQMGQGLENYRTAKHLERLYVLMHRYIRTADDIERAGKGVYSPGLRDDAQDGRNALFTMLSDIPGKATYLALRNLVHSHPNVDARSWMGTLARRRAETDGDLEPWSTDQVREFDRYQARTPGSNRQLFDLSVDRLTDMRNWLQTGDDSPYRTWQRAGDEVEMRNLIADHLKRSAAGRYTCAQENELANAQRPDIWVQSPAVTDPVPIELKVLDKGWSGPDLCERLRNQLVGDYLRHGTSRFGVFLLVWQGPANTRRWRINCQRRSKIRPLWRSKSRPVWGERLGACGPHIASPVQGALAVRPIL